LELDLDLGTVESGNASNAMFRNVKWKPRYKRESMEFIMAHIMGTVGSGRNDPSPMRVDNVEIVAVVTIHFKPSV
jgi:hypothetical protein